MMHANSHATTLVKVLDTFYRSLVYPSLLYVSSIHISIQIKSTEISHRLVRLK